MDREEILYTIKSTVQGFLPGAKTRSNPTFNF